MKTENIITKIREEGYVANTKGDNVVVHVGKMAADYEKTDFATEYAAFQSLIQNLQGWCSRHNTSGRREGADFVIYGNC